MRLTRPSKTALMNLDSEDLAACILLYVCIHVYRIRTVCRLHACILGLQKMMTRSCMHVLYYTIYKSVYCTVKFHYSILYTVYSIYM
jgi:hypothetical protein